MKLKKRNSFAGGDTKHRIVKTKFEETKQSIARIDTLQKAYCAFIFFFVT